MFSCFHFFVHKEIGSVHTKDKGENIMSEQKDFKPFIPADKKFPEFTVTSVILGALLAILFGGANAYLGLRVGITVSASIPAAVISMGILRFILRKDSVLENNMVQSIGSAGESLAAGAIFTMPVLFMWASENGTDAPSFLEIAVIAFCGGVLGVLFMVPLRAALIVKEHGVLPYPEGTACAEVLLAGEEGGTSASTVFAGLGISAAYKFVADGLKLFPSEVDYEIKSYKGAGFGVDVLPALAGVGFICGPKIASYMLSGGLVAWVAIMPLIALFGMDSILYPTTTPIREMGTWDIWSNYIRYIGAGAVLAGGLISLLKSFPLIIKTFGEAIKGFSFQTSSTIRTQKDLPSAIVVLGIGVMAVFMWLCPVIPINLGGAMIIIVFGFFFATVSSRMVGLVGSSNNPVSGMTIATLLLAAILLKQTGNTGTSGMIAAITIGSVICIIAAMAGDTSQDLKTGYIVGATPVLQQIGELIGALVAAITIGGVLYLLNAAWGYGSTELPAPQASLMKMVVEGVMGGNLPWTLVLSGVGIAVVVEILGIPVLPFAVGLYLPIHLSTPIMAGGLVRLYMEKKKGICEEERKRRIGNGTLYTSGLIAGEGLVGILLAVFAIVKMDGKSLADWINLSGVIRLGNIGGLAFFAALLASIVFFMNREKKGSR